MRLMIAAALAALAFPVLAETPSVSQPTTAAAPPAQAGPDDPFLWLEDIHGQRALDWVERENARSLAVLKGDPRYEAFHQEALKIVNATDRIPDPELIGATVYNFWQDPTNVHGLWRRATPQSYATASPAWETVLDLDKLSADEKANWVWHGANCPPPTYRRCLVGLSDGGEDADTQREFDLATKSFVPGGFNLPRSKQNVDWLDDDTLIVARDWGPGTMTASSYPFVVKTLKRGQSLDQATEVFRGKPDDVQVAPTVLHDADGHKVVLIVRAVDFYHQETYWLTGQGAVQLSLPAKITVHGLLDGFLIFTTEQDWTYGVQHFKAGSRLIAMRRLLQLAAGNCRAHPGPKVVVCRQPGSPCVRTQCATVHRAGRRDRTSPGRGNLRQRARKPGQLHAGWRELDPRTDPDPAEFIRGRRRRQRPRRSGLLQR